jgi:hypothetical protein
VPVAVVQSTGINHVVTGPVLATPATRDNLLVVFSYVTAVVAQSVPPGWTALGYVINTHNNRSMQAAYRAAVGGETTLAIGTGWDSINACAHAAIEVSGVTLTLPAPQINTIAGGADTPNHTCGAALTPVAGSNAILIGGCVMDNGGANTPGTDVVEIYDGTNFNSDIRCFAAYKLIPVAAGGYQLPHTCFNWQNAAMQGLFQAAPAGAGRSIDGGLGSVW